MSVVSEVRLKVVRRINTGNYEHVEITGEVMVGRNSDDDTPKSLRTDALEQVAALLEEAEADHLPKRRSRYNED